MKIDKNMTDMITQARIKFDLSFPDVKQIWFTMIASKKQDKY